MDRWAVRPDVVDGVGRVVLNSAVIAAVLAIAVLITVLPRLGAHHTEEGRTLVEVWSWDIAQKSLDSLTPGFEQTHPDIDVQVVQAGAQVQSRFLLSLASDVGAPTVQQLQDREAAKFIGTGRLFDLTPYASSYGDDFSPAFWSNCLHDGRVRALPWDTGPCAVFYKRWLFERYDVDPESIETWDDFIDVGRLILERSGGRTKMLPMTSAELTPFFEIMMCQRAGGLFDEAGRIILNSQANRDVLALIRRMLDAGICAPVRPYSPELIASYTTDTIASYPTAVWKMQEIKDNHGGTAGKWGVFRLPAFEPGGRRVSNLGGSVLVIPDQGDACEEAWLFLEQANCTVEGQVHQYQNWGLFPAYLPALEHPIFDEPDAFFGGQRVHRLFATELDQIPSLVRTRDWNEALAMVTQTLTAWAEEEQEHERYLRNLSAAMGRKLRREAVDEGAP